MRFINEMIDFCKLVMSVVNGGEFASCPSLGSNDNACQICPVKEECAAHFN